MHQAMKTKNSAIKQGIQFKCNIVKHDNQNKIKRTKILNEKSTKILNLKLNCMQICSVIYFILFKQIIYNNC